jgi:hypothetical protein
VHVGLVGNGQEPRKEAGIDRRLGQHSITTKG